MTGDLPVSARGTESPAESWVQHLRAGGTTPWPRWVREAGASDGREAPPTAGTVAGVPGAAQLELLRRLNELGPVPHRADHVLGRPGPGRGPVHLALPLDPLGPPAPRREVLRVAAGVLADLTAQLPAPAQGRRRRRARRARPAEAVPAFVLEGPPITVAEVRARLAAAGMPEHRPRFSWLGARPDPGPDIAVVLVAPIDESLRQVWAARVQRGAGRAWSSFVAQWAGRGSLPPSAAVDQVAGYWADRLGDGNVHLVAISQPAADPAALVARVLGRPVDAGPAEVPEVAPEEPVRLAPAVVDVLRRVNVVLPFVCPETDRAPRRTALVGLAREISAHPGPVDLPKQRRRWAGSTASRLVDALAETGCVRHGDFEALRTTGPATDRRLGGGEVLDAMVRMIHRVDAELTGASRDGRGGR